MTWRPPVETVSPHPTAWCLRAHSFPKDGGYRIQCAGRPAGKPSKAGEQGALQWGGSHLVLSPAISVAPLLVPYSTEHLRPQGSFVALRSLALFAVGR